jgi:hypothetical protein
MAATNNKPRRTIVLTLRIIWSVFVCLLGSCTVVVLVLETVFCRYYLANPESDFLFNPSSHTFYPHGAAYVVPFLANHGYMLAVLLLACIILHTYINLYLSAERTMAKRMLAIASLCCIALSAAVLAYIGIDILLNVYPSFIEYY